MHLNDEQQAMLRVERGETMRELLQFQIEVGSFFGTNALMALNKWLSAGKRVWRWPMRNSRAVSASRSGVQASAMCK